MSWWQGILLGLVQGFTEFLPVSSSGHLVVAEATMGLQTPGLLVEIVLHVATLLAVVIVYRKTLGKLAAGAIAADRAAWRYIFLLLLASIPAGIVGVTLQDWFARMFDSLTLVGVNFLITGTVLWSTRGRTGRGERPTAKGALGIGVAQALAILPGISRSGTTVAAAMWLGVDAVRAAEFSFLLAIPAIAGAALLQIPDLSGDVVSIGVFPMVAGFVAALVSGVLAIRVLIALLRSQAFHRFAPYCWTIGIITVLFGLLGT